MNGHQCAVPQLATLAIAALYRSSGDRTILCTRAAGKWSHNRRPNTAPISGDLWPAPRPRKLRESSQKQLPLENGNPAAPLGRRNDSTGSCEACAAPQPATYCPLPELSTCRPISTHSRTHGRCRITHIHTPELPCLATCCPMNRHHMGSQPAWIKDSGRAKVLKEFKCYSNSQPGCRREKHFRSQGQGG
jgi:hypothetical protein